MVDFLITADVIRRFPFAVAPHRVTDDLQILIARDMAEQAAREGNKAAMPQHVKDETNERFATQVQVNQMILDLLAKGGRKSRWAIRNAIGRDSQTISAAIRRLMRCGVIVQHPGRTKHSYTYELNRQAAQGAA